MHSDRLIEYLYKYMRSDRLIEWQSRYKVLRQ